MEKEVKKVAKPKTTVKVSIDDEKELLLKKTKEQEEVISTLTKQNIDSMSTLEMLQKQMQDMQTAFIQMQSNSKTSSVNDTSSKSYEMGSRLINGVTLYDPKRVVERGNSIKSNN